MLYRPYRRALVQAIAALWLAQATGSGGPVASAGSGGDFGRWLDQHVPALLARHGVPGVAIALVRNGAVAWAAGYGLADAASGRPVTPETVFQVASVSKPVAAWGIVCLAEQGRLDLDAPVDRYLTRWHLPPSELDVAGVTARRLLSHTAGLSLPGYWGTAPDQPLPTLEESLSGATDGAGDVRLVQAPGEGWRYSGGGYTLLQLLAEEVSGRPFAAYMQEAVLGPLGMAHSGFVWTPDLRVATATAYDDAGQALPNYLFAEEAAAGLYATAPDLARWVAATMPGPDGEPAGRGVLTPNGVAALLAPQPATDGQYGLGYFLGHAGKGPRVAWHAGFNRGWRAYFALLPAGGEGLVVLTNSDNGYYLVEDIAAAWGDRLGIGPVPTDPEIETASAANSRSGLDPL